MRKILFALLFPISVFAQPSPPPLTIEESDATVTRPTYNIDFGSCFDVGAASTEANISFDSSECTVNADALKANGANCSAGNYPLGVDAAGAVESCTADDDVPESGDLAAATLNLVTTNGNTTGNQVEFNHDITSASPATGAFANAATVNSDAAPAALAAFYNTLTVGYSAGASTSVPMGVYNNVIFNNPNNSPSVDLIGLNFLTQHNSVATIDDIFGIYGTVGMTGGGVADSAIGVRAGYANIGSAGTLSNYSDFSSLSIVNGILTDYYFAKAVAPIVGGTLDKLYGLYIPTWTAGTNNYPVWIEGAGKIHLREAGTSVHSSATGNLDLTAATATNINTGSLILPANNQKLIIGDIGTRGSFYDDGLDFIINPQEAGSGVLNIGPTGNKDLRVNEMGLCGTSLTGSTSIVTGSCSGSKRGVLSFSFTKNAGTGVTANIGSNLTYDLAANANSQAFTSTYGINNGSSGTNTHKHLNASGMNFTFSPSSGTYKLYGVDLAAPIAPASASGATIYQIGVQQRAFTAFPSATAETLIGGLFEDTLAIKRNVALNLEATGGASPTLGDTTITYDHATDTRIEVVVNGVEVVDMDEALPLQLNQATNDTTVQRTITAATNDDPTENLRQGRIATTDATVTTINTIATTTDTALMLECDIVSRRTGGSSGTAGDIGSYHLYCSAKNVSGTVTEIAETEDFTGESQAGWDVSCAVSGTNYLVQVTGAANNDVTWHSTCRTYEVGS